MGLLTTLLLLNWLCPLNVYVDVIFVNDCCFYLNIKLYFKNLVATKRSSYHPQSREFFLIN
jgi:hypothetical protein